MCDPSVAVKPPQIRVVMDGKEQEQDDAPEEQTSKAALEDEGSRSADKDTQVKVQSAFQQVRDQIRSQAGKRTPKNSIMELVQKVKERQGEVPCENGDPEDVSEKRAEDASKSEKDLSEDALCAIVEMKLEDSKKALKHEFEEQISLMRKEMQAYTDQALKDLERQMQSWRSHPKEQQDPSKCPDRRHKPPPQTASAARRGRVLMRTMTTIVPKTCAPVIVGPRAKSESLGSSKAESFRVLHRDPFVSAAGSGRSYQNRRPLPLACPPVHPHKKPVCTKPKTGGQRT